MDPIIREVADLVVRWIHLIAGIMWIGNSMLWNWIDRNLVKPAPEAGKGEPNDKSFGHIWLLHSGAYYFMEKKLLQPSEYAAIPGGPHWFKWQAYTTWLSGASLLAIVYYMSGGGAYLVDPNVSKISADAAIDVGIGTVVGGFVVYDLVWRVLGRRSEKLATALTLALVAGVVTVLPRVLAGRAAYMHVGAMLGTMMAGNVFLHIMPSQRALVRATQEGSSGDATASAHAKQRSIHNNYLTFPMLFIMLSNHFPSTYGSKYPSLVLAVLIVTGSTVRHLLNVRFHFKRWLPALLSVITTAVVALFVLVGGREALGRGGPKKPAEKVAFSRVQLVIQDRCVPCHSQKPTDPSVQMAPGNVMFDTPEQIQTYKDRIKMRAVVAKTMPLANKTNMTEDERDLVGKWLLSGASIE